MLLVPFFFRWLEALLFGDHHAYGERGAFVSTAAAGVMQRWPDSIAKGLISACQPPVTFSVWAQQ